MTNQPLSDDLAIGAVAALGLHGSQTAAARELGIRRSTFSNRLRVAAERGFYTPDAGPSIPSFPADDLPIEAIIDQQCQRFEARRESYKAHTWFPVELSDNRPIGIMWFGDPHVDDNGCDWPTLRDHVRLCEDTEGLYGANIGDTTNNWSGRLVKLYANQDTSVKTARRLAKWLMLDCGVTWLLWLLGNHDLWGDGAEVLAQMAARHGTKPIVCHDWEARFRLTFPNGWQPRVFAAHDFKGNSQWNPLHGPMKTGQMGAEADLYVCGHKHNWALFSWENADRGLDQTFIRVRGYKLIDSYAKVGGFPQQRKGHAILTVFDPSDQTITSFEDVEKGARFLTSLRRVRVPAAKAA